VDDPALDFAGIGDETRYIRHWFLHRLSAKISRLGPSRNLEDRS
jgi:hypothetical protein